MDLVLDECNRPKQLDAFAEQENAFHPVWLLDTKIFEWPRPARMGNSREGLLLTNYKFVISSRHMCDDFPLMSK